LWHLFYQLSPIYGKRYWLSTYGSDKKASSSILFLQVFFFLKGAERKKNIKLCKWVERDGDTGM
jgi:hypothetical protein